MNAPYPPHKWRYNIEPGMRYALFRIKMSRMGYDPDLIGEHEVPPVCCEHCGHKIPWALIKGYRD